MAYGYAARAGQPFPGFYEQTVRLYRARNAQGYAGHGFDVAEDDVTKALIPFIDSNFRNIGSDRDHRAMAVTFPWVVCRPFKLLSITWTYFPTWVDSVAPAECSSWAIASFLMRVRTITACLPTLRHFPGKACVLLLWLGVGTVEPERIRTGLQRLQPLSAQ